MRHDARRLFMAGALLGAALGPACDLRLHPDQDLFLCATELDCADGYRCAGVLDQTRRFCIPEDERDGRWGAQLLVDTPSPWQGIDCNTEGGLFEDYFPVPYSARLFLLPCTTPSDVTEQYLCQELLRRQSEALSCTLAPSPGYCTGIGCGAGPLHQAPCYLPPDAAGTDYCYGIVYVVEMQRGGGLQQTVVAYYASWLTGAAVTAGAGVPTAPLDIAEGTSLTWLGNQCAASTPMVRGQAALRRQLACYDYSQFLSQNGYAGPSFANDSHQEAAGAAVDGASDNGQCVFSFESFAAGGADAYSDCGW